MNPVPAPRLNPVGNRCHLRCLLTSATVTTHFKSGRACGRGQPTLTTVSRRTRAPSRSTPHYPHRQLSPSKRLSLQRRRVYLPFTSVYCSRKTQNHHPHAPSTCPVLPTLSHSSRMMNHQPRASRAHLVARTITTRVTGRLPRALRLLQTAQISVSSRPYPTSVRQD